MSSTPESLPDFEWPCELELEPGYFETEPYNTLGYEADRFWEFGQPMYAFQFNVPEPDAVPPCNGMELANESLALTMHAVESACQSLRETKLDSDKTIGGPFCCQESSPLEVENHERDGADARRGKVDVNEMRCRCRRSGCPTEGSASSSSRGDLVSLSSEETGSRRNGHRKQSIPYEQYLSTFPVLRQDRETLFEAHDGIIRKNTSSGNDHAMFSWRWKPNTLNNRPKTDQEKADKKAMTGNVCGWCKGRKKKCDLSTPCGPCIKAGKQNECTRQSNCKPEL